MANNPLISHEEPELPDTLQTWDLYNWLNDLSNIKDAYGVEAQTQFDYENIMPPNVPYQASGSAETRYIPVGQMGINNAVWTHDLVESNGTLLKEVNNAIFPTGQEIEGEGFSFIGQGQQPTCLPSSFQHS